MSLEDNSQQIDGNTGTETQTDSSVSGAAGQTVAEEYEFKWNGKPVKGTREKVLTWASQGYDYAQQVARMKAEREAWEQETAQIRQINEYAAKNPQWYDHWKKAYESRDSLSQNVQANPQTGDDPIAPLRQQLEELNKFRDEIMTQRQREQAEREDKELSKEVEDIRKNYPTLDWNTLDDNGHDLEMRVMKYGHENGFKTFRAAFRDLMFDDAVKHHLGSQAEAKKKSIQADAKKGVVDRSKQPFGRNEAPPKNIKNQSYEDIANEIRQDLRARGIK
jgi:hypothetical protein